MVTQVTHGRALPAEVMNQIVAKTDGNPLFVEELTKAVLEGDILVKDADGYRLDGPLPPLAIPATLQGSLMARLDRLAPVKEIGQIGIAIGREFSYSLMREVVGRDEPALKHALAKLEQAELVSAVVSPRKLSIASSTRWCGMRHMRVCSRAGGSNCTAGLRAQWWINFPTLL
jgi:predicted ATPase